MIDERIIPILRKIDFANKYKLLCNKFSNFENRLVDYDYSLIKQFYEDKKLKVSFVKNEKFFKIIEKVGPFRIQFNTIPYNGFIQFVLSLRTETEVIKIGWGMWESITKELEGWEVTKPIFCSIIELKEILEEAFCIYDDFKRELLKIQS